MRYPFAPCTSTPSNPARTALRAAAAKSATVASASAVVIARGVTCSTSPSRV